MPIAPERKNSLVLAREFRDDLRTRTGINDFDSDSKSEALVGVFVDQVLANRDESINAFYANQITNARGEQLDEIGRDMGLPRLGETFANVVERDRSLAFYVATGTFGDINGGADITITAGTKIYSDQNQNELGARITFVVTEGVTLRAGSSVGYVQARCETSGSRGNVGAGVLNNHDFTSYLAGTGLRVVNFYSVLNGRSRELDRNYRFRLARRYDTLVTSNDSKLHLTALRVPGVLDTRIIRNYYGVGTVGVVILGPEEETSDSILRGVQARLQTLQGPGASITAVAATSVQFDIEAVVQPVRSMDASQKRQFELDMRRALRNYFRSVGIGGTVTLADAAEEVSRYVETRVRLVSTGRPQAIFDTVYIRKGPNNGTATERDLLENDLYTMTQEEFADMGTLSISYV